MILLTSMTNSNVPQSARDSGFSAYLTKPVRRGDLFRTIARSVGDKAPEADPVATVVADRPAGRGHALLVEDNLVNQEIGAAMLDNLGFRVDIADNGAEAVAMFEQRRYDVILMDCQMPELDGFAATGQIRALEASAKSPRTPIIALTANAMQGDREHCLSAGMDDYLAKPFSKAKLSALIALWVDTSAGATRQPDGAKQVEVVTAQRPASVAILDQSVLADIRALERSGVPSLLCRVIDRYLIDSERLIQEMRVAIEKSDTAMLARAAHTLKSSSANVGARGLAELCKVIETHVRTCNTSPASGSFEVLKAELDQASVALRAEAAQSAGSADALAAILTPGVV
jgi:CheY-like chemotaxis protein